MWQWQRRRFPSGTPEQTAEIKDLTARVFKALNSRGVVRVDFIIDNSDDKVYVNEINTIPGSFAFYLWDFEGIKYHQLIDKLVQIAEEEFEEKKKNNYTYKSDIIAHATSALKTGGGTKN